MATVSTLAIPAARLPRSTSEFVTAIVADIPVVSGTAASGDDVTVFTPPAGARVIGAKLRQTATLGASATAQLDSGFLQDTVHEAEGTTGVVSDLPDALARGVPLGVLGSKRCPLRPGDA